MSEPPGTVAGTPVPGLPGAVWCLSGEPGLDAEGLAPLLGKSVSTVRRRARDGKIPGAEQSQDGKREWYFPFSRLRQSGLVPSGGLPEALSASAREHRPEHGPEHARARARVTLPPPPDHGDVSAVEERVRRLEERQADLEQENAGLLTGIDGLVGAVVGLREALRARHGPRPIEFDDHQ